MNIRRTPAEGFAYRQGYTLERAPLPRKQLPRDESDDCWLLWAIRERADELDIELSLVKYLEAGIDQAKDWLDEHGEPETSRPPYDDWEPEEPYEDRDYRRMRI